MLPSCVHGEDLKAISAKISEHTWHPSLTFQTPLPKPFGKMPNFKVNLEHLVPEIKEMLKTEVDMSRR